MTIQEYKEYYDQHLQKKVDKFMKKTYKDAENILCWFYRYFTDIKHKNHIVAHPWKIELDREDYATLLTVLLKHPEITFQELPCFIPYKLYEEILISLRFPAIRHYLRPDDPEPRSNPIGIDMTSLQDDANAIAGDEPYSFLLNSYTYNPKLEFESLDVIIWIQQMEVRISYTINKQANTVIYGMIDVEAVKKALRVKTNKGIESSLSRYGKKLPKEKSDIFWLVRWLDSHGIKYVYAEDKIMNFQL